jgi:hypothetical protein
VRLFLDASLRQIHVRNIYNDPVKTETEGLLVLLFLSTNLNILVMWTSCGKQDEEHNFLTKKKQY